MRAFNSLFALLAASAVTVTAMQSPHEKASKYKRSASQPVYTRDTAKANTTSLFLTDKSKSRFPLFNYNVLD